MRAFTCFLFVTLCALRAEAAESSEQLSLAKERFHEAAEAHERGAHAEAARLFEEAYRLAPRAQALFNAAVAWQEANEPERAANNFETALAVGGLEEPNLDQARSRLEVLKRTLGYLLVPEPVGGQLSVGHLERVSIPVRTHLGAGTYLVRIVYPNGATLSKQIKLAAGEAQTLNLPSTSPTTNAEASPTNAPAPSPQPTSHNAQKAAPMAAFTAPRPEQPRTDSNRQFWGWFGVGTGAVLAGGAVVLGVKFLQANQAWDDSGNRDKGKESQAHSLRLFTNLAWAGAAASTGTGLLLLSSPKFEF
ncbi:MAG: hypothetical protein SFV15_24790 [Polyangiaceae bacterium]|nr:hypothetical protein [Polyangiaceae bacterium]